MDLSDADGDGIPDFVEGSLDTDGDGDLDRMDTDSDGDGVSDAEEAGDDDLRTPPVDTDSDSTPDYLDPDSDNDGLSDADEATLGSSRTEPDSDNDGVTDLVEFLANTSATDASDNPRANGDFFFEVPYQAPPTPPRSDLAFQTAIRKADIYFSFDTSTTMIGEIDALRSPASGVPAIIDALRCPTRVGSCTTDAECGVGEACGTAGVCVESPSVNGCLLDLYTGVGAWHSINTFVNLQSLQADPAVTIAAMPTAPHEYVAPLQAVSCMVDPANCLHPANCASSGVGCPGFREDAVAIYVHVTDANDECTIANVLPVACDAFTPASVGAQMGGAGIRFIGLVGDGPIYGPGVESVALAEAIGTASGTTRRSDGTPFVFRATDAAVVQATTDAVRELVTDGAFDLRIHGTDDPADTVDALQFIDRFEVNLSAPGCSTGAIIDSDGDGFMDAFQGVAPGSTACWDVVVQQNTNVMPTAAPQVFKAQIAVSASGSQVDARDVYFLVPPVVEISTPPLL